MKQKKMMVIPYMLTIFFLCLMIVVGASDIYQDYQTFGWSYEETTIIQEITTVRTVNLSSSIIMLLFLVWVVILLSAILIIIQY